MRIKIPQLSGSSIKMYSFTLFNKDDNKSITIRLVEPLSFKNHYIILEKGNNPFDKDNSYNKKTIYNESLPIVTEILSELDVTPSYILKLDNRCVLLQLIKTNISDTSYYNGTRTNEEHINNIKPIFEELLTNLLSGV
jgi:hypothetical protein